MESNCKSNRKTYTLYTIEKTDPIQPNEDETHGEDWYYKQIDLVRPQRNIPFKPLQRIRNSYYWPGRRNEAQTYVRTWDSCQRFKVDQTLIGQLYFRNP